LLLSLEVWVNQVPLQVPAKAVEVVKRANLWWKKGLQFYGASSRGWQRCWGRYKGRKCVYGQHMFAFGKERGGGIAGKTQDWNLCVCLIAWEYVERTEEVDGGKGGVPDRGGQGIHGDNIERALWKLSVG